MLGFLISYFYMMAALMLTLDFPISFLLLASVLIILLVYLLESFITTTDGYLTILRSVRRTE